MPRQNYIFLFYSGHKMGGGGGHIFEVVLIQAPEVLALLRGRLQTFPSF